MSATLVQQIADAVLYEGYLLYPYRPSALKNRLRWTFGVLYPEACGDASSMQTECLVVGAARTRLEWTVRFLQLVGDEAVERTVAESWTLSELLERPRAASFSFPAANGLLAGTATCSAEALAENLVKLRVRIDNQSSLEKEVERQQALARSLISTHTILGVREGEFVSLLEPPEAFAGFAAGCRNVGTWPVLVGAAGEKSWLLSSPILLYDYPRVAAESPGDLFDGTEIDELLTLRIQTLTDEEKRALRADKRAGRLLERVEQLAPEQLSQLHGTMRRQSDLKPGDRVRLRPRAGADVFDLALAGQLATVQKVEVDLEGRVYLAVTVDDDPGRDLGLEGKPGHRFFFRPEELERIEEADQNVCPTGPRRKRILVAGIGNIFLGDDAFGVEVVRQLAQQSLTEEATVIDFGIRGLDLAYALQDGYDLAILIDATRRGGAPGTLYLIEPDTEDWSQEETTDAHGMVPHQAIQFARGVGGPLPSLRLIGCEPATLAPDQDGVMGLSEPVQAAVEPAIELVRSLVAEVLGNTKAAAGGLHA